MVSGELTAQAATLGLAIGLVMSLLCYLLTDLSPGGMVTPGWIAIAVLQDYRQALMIAATTVVTFGLSRVLSRITILYGKRLFASVVLIGVLTQLTALLLLQKDFPLLFVHQTLGFIVPGLIAYQLRRQRIWATLLATGGVAAATYAVLLSGVLVGVVPVM
jgi:poly-gamma-glutamate biosynthesis protein PgsC/CapC